MAIELAAVRTRILTAQQILDRLTNRFGLLTGGGRAGIPRHQTLRTTIDAPPVAQAKASTRAALGTPTFQAEFEVGKRLSRGAAIGLALGEPARVTAAASGDTGAPPLGKREAEVAHLVADGLSNKQIGARLLISEHTVDSHIRNIMNKLGFSSRAQIAAWMASSDQ